MDESMEAQRRQKRLKRNVTCVLGLGFFQVFLVIMPVIVPFFQSRGLSMSDVLLLQAVFACVVIAMEVPSGYIADVLGRKRSLVTGALFIALGHACLLFANSFAELALFETLLGIGTSLVSGADLAILYDTEQALAGNSEHPESVVGRLFSLHTAGEATASLVCSLVLTWLPMDVVVYVQVVAGSLPLVLALALHEPPGERLHRHSHMENVREIVVHLLRNGAVLRYTFAALCVWSLTTFYAVWFLQQNWQDQGVELRHFGYLWGTLMLVSAFSGRYAQRAERKLGVAGLLTLIGIAPVVGYLGLAYFGMVGGLLVSLTFFVSRGLGLVVLRDAFNRRLPGKFRATANSLASLGFRLAYVGTAPLVGAVLDGWGFQATMVLLAAGTVAVFAFLIVPLIAAVSEARRSACPSAISGLETAPTKT
jgi:MFS family permease